MKTVLQTLVTASLILSLIACTASRQLKDAYEQFDLSVNNYGGAIRWGNYQEAMSFCQSRLNKIKKTDWKHFDKIQITSYEIRDKVLNPDIKEAYITMVFSYYIRDRGVVKTLVNEQTWWYDNKQRRWFIDGGIPEFPG